jgi:hypothetical protein
MNMPRMLAFFAAVLIAACLLRAVADRLTVPPRAAAGASVNSHAAAD